LRIVVEAYPLTDQKADFHEQFIDRSNHEKCKSNAGRGFGVCAGNERELRPRAGLAPVARGQPGRETTGFKAPQTWPKELGQKWKVTVGNGVATPALVGDKLYVFAREGGSEVIRCLNSGDGKELWQEKYDALPAEGPAGQFPGPRSSPTVVDGKVVTLGVRGVLSCLDEPGSKWRTSRPTLILSSRAIAYSSRTRTP
jgi:outer membrane protein assembly factor BamB